jgi:hypothetical protein
MKLTIQGKDYEFPEFSAADFDDWKSEIEIANNTAKDKTFIDVQGAAVKVLVEFAKASFPELAHADNPVDERLKDRAIKKSIPSRLAIKMFGELLYGKKDDAPATPAGA